MEEEIKSRWFKEGESAYFAGKEIYESPYYDDTLQGDEWLSGWVRAKYEDIPKEQR